MATEKQINALTKILTEIVRQDTGWPPTPAQLAAYRGKVAAMSLPQVRAEFKKLNGVTGFNRYTSEATNEQRGLLGRLEIEMHGKMQNAHYSVKLNYQQASEMIADLIAQRDAKNAA